MAGAMQQNIIAFAIGCSLIVAGFYVLPRMKISLTVRALLGAAMLVSGIALIYPLIDGNGTFQPHQIRFGLSVALLGLGINQLAAPVRVALGRPA